MFPVQILSERNKRQQVKYWTKGKPGMVVVDPFSRFAYLVTS